MPTKRTKFGQKRDDSDDLFRVNERKHGNRAAAAGQLTHDHCSGRQVYKRQLERLTVASAIVTQGAQKSQICRKLNPARRSRTTTAFEQNRRNPIQR